MFTRRKIPRASFGSQLRTGWYSLSAVSMADGRSPVEGSAASISARSFFERTTGAMFAGAFFGSVHASVARR